MTCRDWASTLRRASFRGAPFFVEADQVGTGRRLVVHEFPNSENWYVEDLGRRANSLTVTAYVVGEDVEGATAKLFKACDVRGAAQLNLPMARLTAHCEDCQRDYSKDKQGYIAFQLKFVAKSSSAAPFASVASARAVEFGATGLQPMIADAFSRQFVTLDQPGFVVDAAIDQVQSFAAGISEQVRTTLIDGNVAAVLLSKADAIFSKAAELTLFGAVGDTFTERSYLATSQSQLDVGLVPAVFGLFEAAREGLSPDVAVGFMREWLEWGDDPIAGITPSTIRLAKNTAVINNVVRFSAAAQYAAAIVNRTYADPRVARQARADSAEYLGALLEGLSGWETYEVGKEIYALRGQIAEHLSSLITTLAPVLVVNAPRRMPSLWWANRLYADANRAGELAQRNSVKHASFMPTEFEALAR